MLRRLILAFIFLTAATAYAHGNLKFVNGRWFDGSSFQPKTMYSVEGVLRSDWTGAVNETIDLAGRFVVPPFADAHNHLFADPQSFAQQTRRSLRDGIFYIKNPNSPGQVTARARLLAGKPETVDVLYSNGGITASGGHPIQIYEPPSPAGGPAAPSREGDAYFVIDRAEDIDAVWPRIAAGKPDFIKTYLEHSEEFEKRRADREFRGQRGLDPAVLRAIVTRAHREGLSVTTHIATAADFRNALAAGVDEITHLPLERITEADAKTAARQHAVVVTTTLSHRPTGGITDLDAIHRDNLRRLLDAGATVVFGVDNGNHSVLDEIENVRRLGVFSTTELLKTAWTTTTVSIFPKRKVGRLADGYEASFLALDGNPLEDPSAIHRVAIRVKQGHRLEIPEEKPSAADVLVPIATAGGAAAAIAEYDKLRRAKPVTYDYGEAALNRVGYALLSAGNTAGAITVFVRNTELFPKSANVWDSLGEAYMHSGEKALAIANYRKSLALNPHNENAVKMLEKLGEKPNPR